MQDRKTFNQWLSLYGMRWAEGKEQMLKSTLSQTEFENLMRDYADRGEVLDK